ncbi:hypothetical protein [Streptomyces sp. NPDC086147]|uniref:hypothetical protein n=1 Tax=Streptomyces sp. NPDC086147 TaxID=3155295 RepID=UPI00344E503A
MKEEAGDLDWALENYFAQRLTEARQAGALLLDDRVARMAIQAAEYRRDKVCSNGERLTNGEALDLLVSLGRWCPATELPTRRKSVVAALRAEGYDV